MKIKRGEMSAPWGGIYSFVKKREELSGEEFNGGKIIGNRYEIQAELHIMLLWMILQLFLLVFSHKYKI